MEGVSRICRSLFGFGIAVTVVGLSKGWLDWSIFGVLAISIGSALGWNDYWMH